MVEEIEEMFFFEEWGFQRIRLELLVCHLFFILIRKYLDIKCYRKAFLNLSTLCLI